MITKIKPQFLLIMLFFAVQANAAEAEKTLGIKSIERINGEITSTSFSSIGILYETKGAEEFEMMFPFSPKKVKLSGYKKLSEVKLRDVVEVEYEKIVEKQDSGTEKISMNAQTIKLLRRPAENVSLEGGGSGT